MNTLIKFREFRIYEESRIQMNDSIMTILVGLGLASNTVNKSHKSNEYLTKVFSAVDHVERMDVTLLSYEAKLVDAESHLAIMAVPYVLSLHEEYVISSLKMVSRAGLINSAALRNVKAKFMHEKFATATSTSFPADLLNEFHVMRSMRNAFIHNAGVSEGEILTYYAQMSQTSKIKWQTLAEGRSLANILQGEKIDLAYPEIKLALLITNELSRIINNVLVQKIPKIVWRDILLEDFLSTVDTKKDFKVLERKLKKFALNYYSPITFSENDYRLMMQNVR